MSTAGFGPSAHAGAARPASTTTVRSLEVFMKSPFADVLRPGLGNLRKRHVNGHAVWMAVGVYRTPRTLARPCTWTSAFTTLSPPGSCDGSIGTHRVVP